MIIDAFFIGTTIGCPNPRSSFPDKLHGITASYIVFVCKPTFPWTQDY